MIRIMPRVTVQHCVRRLKDEFNIRLLIGDFRMPNNDMVVPRVLATNHNRQRGDGSHRCEFQLFQ